MKINSKAKHALTIAAATTMSISVGNAFVVKTPLSKTSSFISSASSYKHPDPFQKTHARFDTTETKLSMMNDILSPEILSHTSSTVLSFTDQGQNLAGIFFQASLLPYVTFLYFLNFRGNRVPKLGNFGFQFLLLFVLATIPSGIISKSVYGLSLANVDWLHGGAEALLTITTLLIVFGFREASIKETPPPLNLPRTLALSAAGVFAIACGLGTNVIGFDPHSQFLFGLGNLSTDFVSTLPWVTHTEPINGLSIPTWAIHFSSVFEWIFAMSIIWNFSYVADNPKWKGLTWGMLPLHASGLAACTYHFFYNNPDLQFLVSLQAGLTLLGNITLAIAAYRIATSNGWTFRELNPFPTSNTSPADIRLDQLTAQPLDTNTAAYTNPESEASLAVKLALLTFATAYAVKYGELGFDLPFTSNAILATLIVFTPVAITSTAFANRAKLEENGGPRATAADKGFLRNLFGTSNDDDDSQKPILSMQDIKKYGVAGTVAYVLTELAFWAVAFPVASTALYQTTGHWPDLINDPTDRATVVGFIFAGANIARLAVPLRLGAALALAPWVDENIINRGAGADADADGNETKEEERQFDTKKE